MDFVLCCSGGCLITYSVPGEAASPVTGLRLAAVGERGALPVLAYRYGVQPHVLCTLHGVFAGAGMTYMNADTPGFRGGVGMGMDYLKRYSPESEGLGCKIHFWYDGSQYFDNYVSAEALRHVFPVSQARVYFSGNAVAQGAAAFAKNAFGDGIALHMDDCGFRITSPFADYVYGVRRYMHLAGIEDADVWAVGYMAEDAALMKEFCGIAIEGSPAEKTGTARYTVSDVTEAVQITEKEAL